jgi:hypothetical protein
VVTGGTNRPFSDPATGSTIRTDPGNTVISEVALGAVRFRDELAPNKANPE